MPCAGAIAFGRRIMATVTGIARPVTAQHHDFRWRKLSRLPTRAKRPGLCRCSSPCAPLGFRPGQLRDRLPLFSTASEIGMVVTGSPGRNRRGSVSPACAWRRIAGMRPVSATAGRPAWYGAAAGTLSRTPAAISGHGAEDGCFIGLPEHRRQRAGSRLAPAEVSGEVVSAV